MAAKRKAAKKKDTGLGLFIAGAAAAASAGAYYLYGPKGKQHRKEVRGWMLKASGEVMERVEKIKHIDEVRYQQIVDQVEAKYRKVRDIDNNDIAKLKRDLKAQWKEIEKEAKKGAVKGKKEVAKAKKVAKKTQTKARKAVHKAATKVAKKTAPKKQKSTTKK